MRVIKVITKNNEQFNIEINSKESEVRDLLSSISGVSGKEIIGICDKFCTYYTLSFAVNNPSINNELSEYYFLITAPKHENGSHKNKNNQHTHNYAPVDKIEKGGHKRHAGGKKEKNIKGYNSADYYLNSGNTNSNANVNSYLNPNNTFSNYNTLYKNQTQGYENDYGYNDSYLGSQQNLMHNINSNFGNPQSTNNMNNLYSSNLNNQSLPHMNNSHMNLGSKVTDHFNNMNHKHREDSSSSFNIIKDDEIKEEMEKYVAIVNDFLNYELISQISAIRIQKMITEEKVNLTNNFKKFISGRLNLKEFLQSIEDNLIEDDLKIETNLSSRPRTAIPTKKNLIKVIDELPSTIFDDNDHELLKKLARQNYNEIINSAWEVYQSDSDFENFTDSLRRIIIHQKEESKKNSFSSKYYFN